MKILSPVLTLLLLTGIGATAADLSWTGTANTQWNSSSGWSVFSGSSVSGYPESGDVALYNGADSASGAVGSGNTLISGTQSALAMNAFNTVNIDIIGTNGTLNLGTYSRNGAVGATSFRSSGAQSFNISVGNISHTAGTTYFGQNAGAQGLTSFTSTGTTSLNGGILGFHMLNSGTASLNVVNVNGGTMSVRQTSSSGTSAVSIANLTGTSGQITMLNNTAGLGGILLVESGSIGGTMTVTDLSLSYLELVKTGTGTLVWSSTGNALNQVTVENGTLTYGTTSDVFGSSVALTVAGSNAVLNVQAANDAVGVVTLKNGTISSSGGSNGRLNGTAYNVENGVISARLGAGGALTKSTSGTVTLSAASSNTYTDGTFLNGGVLQIGRDDLLGAASGSVAFNGGALRTTASATTARITSVQSGGGEYIVDPATILTHNGTISGSGNLAKSGGGTLILNADNAISGTTSVNAGTLQLGSSGTTGSVAGVINVGSAGTLTITRNANYTFGNTVLGTGIVNAGATGTTAFTSAFSGFSGTVQQNGSSGNYIGAANFDSFANATVSTTNGGGSGRIVTLAGSGTYSFGGMNVANSVSLTAGSTLRLGGNNLNSLQTAGSITASGGFIKVGTGTMTFASTSANSFAGGIWLNDGVVALQGTGALGATGNLTFGGGILQFSSANTTDYSNRLQPVASGQQVRIDTNGQAVTFASAFSGSGGLQKLGSGTLTLAGANSYQGASVVSAGTLLITNSTGAGTGAVNLNGGTVHVNVSSGAGAITNAIVFNNASSSYVLERASGQSLAVYASSSDLVGGTDTAASILAGTAGAARTLTTSFDTIAVASNDSDRMSDVFRLSGTATDLFVLQLDLSSPLESSAYLAWLDGGSWVNAVNGNTGNNASLAQQGYQGSFSAFQTTYGSTLSSYVGAYGVDTTSGSAWAVLNHNSDFALVPEPSTWALLALGFGVLALRARSRRRAA